MRTEVRFLLAIGLMIVVLVGTNLLFPPAPPELGLPPDSTLVIEGDSAEPTGGDPAVPAIPDLTGRAGQEATADTPTVAAEDVPPGDVPTPATQAPPREIVVEGPLRRYVFSTQGARLLSAELLEFRSFSRDGPVQLVNDGDVDWLGQRLLVAGDTVDLRRVSFEPSTELLRVSAESGPATLTFSYTHPTADFGIDVSYRFSPDLYVIDVTGAVRGVEAGTLFTDLGSGLAFTEARPDEESRLSAYVVNNTDTGIRATRLDDVDRDVIVEGPLFWAALKSKFFMLAVLAGAEPDTEAHLSGLIARARPEQSRADITVTQPFGPRGAFAYRLYVGPQDFQRLSALGHDLQDANPYGWRFIRPLIQPFTGLIIRILKWMHESFDLAYGWVLMVFGLLMRVVFFPLYHRSMKAQLKNMAVQPLLKDIQTRYKDNPEKMQKELMKLYKEHGFNPLAGCLPMLLPWPVLVALFFVFQNTIELRGVPFLWLPDLSQADPYYILPIFLGLSMFLLQWVGFRSMDQVNPQMKMMMWFMPIFLVFIFFSLPSGLNLYYATANIATLPQQFWIAQERKRARVNAPPVPDRSEDDPADAKAEAGAPAAGAGRRKGRSRSSRKR